MSISIISQIASKETLKRAWDSVYSGKNYDVRKNSKGIDDVSIFDYKQNLDENLKDLSQKLQNQTYVMQKLHGFLEKKKSGKFRLISAPTVEDRIVHTAILSIIEKYFPEIRNGSSYCLPKIKNRKKINFIDAFRTIIQKIKEGNTCVFESDIESFFDTVSKEKLLKIITGKLPDSSINNLIKDIVYFSIGNIKEFEKKSEQKLLKLPNEKYGLCQGSPLSPLFANIYLIELDEVMISEFGKNYIRYVDDFIVLCKTFNEAKRALQIAKNTLYRMHLTLPPEIDKIESKTNTNIDLKKGDSFIFLGIRVDKNQISPEKIGKKLIHYIGSEVIKPKVIRETFRLKGEKCSNTKISEILNKKIRGTVSYYQYFHTEETIKKLNLYLKKRNEKEKFSLEVIKTNKRIKQVIAKNYWQQLFLT